MVTEFSSCPILSLPCFIYFFLFCICVCVCVFLHFTVAKNKSLMVPSVHVLQPLLLVESLMFLLVEVYRLKFIVFTLEYKNTSFKHFTEAVTG